MGWFERIQIGERERGVVVRRGRPAQWLEPGEHRLGWWGARRARVDRYSLRSGYTEWSPELAEAMPDGVGRELSVGEDRLGLVTRDGVLSGCLLPGRYIVWDTQERVRVTLYSFQGVLTTIPEDVWPNIPESHLRVVTVQSGEEVVLRLDGEQVSFLSEGRYGVCCLGRKIEVSVRSLGS